MRLRLETDTDVLDGTTEDGVCYAGEGAGGIILAVGERLGIGLDLVDGFVLLRGILGFEGAARVVEPAELNRDAGTDADQGGECTLVEGGGALILKDLPGTVEGTFVVFCGLQANFDDI